MNELFNQPLSSLDVTKRLAFGQPSQLGCDNILISEFITELQNLGLCNIIVSSVFEVEDVCVMYTAERYQLIESIIIKGLAIGETVQIDAYVYDSITGLYNLTTLIAPETGQPQVFNISHYCSSANASERVVTITPSANCTVIIKSTKAL